jgi:hypothetical protein
VADLKTLTDHPIFAGSPLNVSKSEARVSDESVLESVYTQIETRQVS